MIIRVDSKKMPIPSKSRHQQKSKYPWVSLKRNQSFMARDVTVSCKALALRVNSALQLFKKTHKKEIKGRMFTIRRIDAHTVRAWRIK